MEYLEAWGTLIDEKNLKSKISCQTPFNNQNPKISIIFYFFANIPVTESTAGTGITKKRFPAYRYMPYQM